MTMLSKLLLSALQTWEVRPVPDIFYHGCRSDDVGINTDSKSISGNKWFSTDQYLAGDYAWHFSRYNPEKVCTGNPLRLELQLISQIDAVVKPREINGKSFPEFLSDCFPEIPPGYDLSKHYQNVLTPHLNAVFPNQNIFAHMMKDGEEILIPACEAFIRIVNVVELPGRREDYRSIYSFSAEL